MESDMTYLAQSMENIEHCTARVNTAMHSRSTKIEELVSMRQFLTKVQALLDLPKQMQQYVKNKKYEPALRLHQQAMPALTAHRNIPRINNVAVEVERLATEAKDRLRARLQTSHIRSGGAVEGSNAVEITRLLLELGDDPLQPLELYFSSKNALLSENLKSLSNPSYLRSLVSPKQHEPTVNSEAINETPSCIFEAFCEQLCKTFNPTLSSTISDANCVFSDKEINSTDFEKHKQSFVEDILRSAMARIMSIAQTEPYPSASVLAQGVNNVRISLAPLQEQLPTLLSKLFSEFLDEMVNSAVSISFTEAYKKMVASLSTLNTVCQDPPSLDDVLEKITETERSFLLQGCLSVQDCQHLSSQLIKHDTAALMRVEQQVLYFLDRYFECFNASCTMVAEREPVCMRIKQLRELTHQAPSSLKNEGGTHKKKDVEATRGLTDLLILEEVDRAARSEYWGDPRGLFCLALMRIGRHLEMKGISSLTNMACETFVLPSQHPEVNFDPILQDWDQPLKSPSSRTENQHPGSTPTGHDAHQAERLAARQPHFAHGTQQGVSSSPTKPPLLKRTRAASHAVLTRYVMVVGQSVALKFRESTSVPGWVTLSAPRDVRQVIERVLADLRSTEKDLSRLLGDKGSSSRKDTSQHHRRMARMFGGLSGVGLGASTAESEIYRLLVRQSAMYGPISFNKQSALAGVLQIALKSMVEDVRREAFNQNGVRQIQLDCAFLSEMLRDIVGDTEEVSTLETLLDEAVMSALNRCVGVAVSPSNHLRHNHEQNATRPD
eukprot:Selendium_serpulae@DN6263_c0_g1_i5.p1